ncbi:hypothetical protein AJ80_05562 [Polytolypa hystricis UAMH7299]|uniref:Aflatoxin regulatory protein domain-containing protein n=1 Tax=Polytolypa hystricis (strain UAMH7299) TaxID=1447883 RepID=A0A2B7Y3H8_POLH7|nr:hypothetical protein AJ80_05562 [Polytolypa hystricis UAMH7299]
MVGKVPGQRAKNGSKSNAQSSKRQSEERTSRPVPDIPTPSTEESLDWGPASLVNFDQGIEASMGFEQNCDSIFDNMEISPDLPPLGSSLAPSSDSSTWMGDNNGSQPIANGITPNCFDLFLTHNDKRLSLLHEQSPMSQPMGLSFRQESHTAERNKCIQGCSDMIQFLERKATVKLNALDDVVRICQTSVTQLSMLMDMDDYLRSISCVPLSCIALSHVISLLEACIASGDVRPDGDGISPRGIQFNVTLPHITFGSLQVHRDDQVKFGCQVFQREITKCVQLLTKLRVQHDRPTTPSGQSFRLMQEQCCSDLERRLEELAKSLDHQS